MGRTTYIRIHFRHNHLQFKCGQIVSGALPVGFCMHYGGLGRVRSNKANEGRREARFTSGECLASSWRAYSMWACGSKDIFPC